MRIARKLIARIVAVGYLVACITVAFGEEVIVEAAHETKKDHSSAPQKPAVTPPSESGHALRPEKPRMRIARSLSIRDWPAFRDLAGVTDLYLKDVTVRSVPDELLRRICVYGSDVENLSIGIGSKISGVAVAEISDSGMEHISRLPKLKALALACRFSPKAFEHLTKLPELKTLGLDYPTLNARQVFEVVAKMPKIQSLLIRHADFSQPIDDATFKAIASLNGRLESLSFGEWQETTIHVSMIPAIAEIKSLKWLELGNYSATYEDMAPIRKNLRNLEHTAPAATR